VKEASLTGLWCVGRVCRLWDISARPRALKLQLTNWISLDAKRNSVGFAARFTEARKKKIEEMRIQKSPREEQVKNWKE
jgi:hypothetical protein